MFISLFIFERQREREREHERRRVRETGRHRIWSRLQAPSCQHRTRCGAQTHKLWDHDLGRSQMLNLLSHPGAPTMPISDISSASVFNSSFGYGHLFFHGHRRRYMAECFSGAWIVWSTAANVEHCELPSAITEPLVLSDRSDHVIFTKFIIWGFWFMGPCRMQD